MWKDLRPEEIERLSFEAIRSEMTKNDLGEKEQWVLQRVIHTSADFEFEKTLYFSAGAVDAGINALKAGAAVITDTNMALTGIAKRLMAESGGGVRCYIADEDVAKEAKERGVTRAVVSMERAAAEYPNAVYAIGNAPTALLRLCELIREGKAHPALVIGAPVGFVNVIESKEEIIKMEVPCIVPRGRKGGSTIAAAIVNALLYGEDAPGVKGS